jgi:hypothetical protein
MACNPLANRANRAMLTARMQGAERLALATPQGHAVAKMTQNSRSTSLLRAVTRTSQPVALNPSSRRGSFRGVARWCYPETPSHSPPRRGCDSERQPATHSDTPAGSATIGDSLMGGHER